MPEDAPSPAPAPPPATDAEVPPAPEAASPPASPPAASSPSEAEAKHPKPRPPGEPAEIVELRELIEAELAKLVEMYGAHGGSYLLGFQSARVFVVPAALESGATVIRVFAITNVDVPVSAGLNEYLVTKNLDFVCGSFALDAEHGAVWFNHNLLGKFAQPEELQATIVMIAETADRFDDEIKSTFGGRLYAESPDQAIAPPNTPGYL
ncbi:MAG TPA: hypothetical protein VNC78_04630 [Actinomycetota bacterium]|nr:hypothetical protein [Actinomycetota bacterium]